MLRSHDFLERRRWEYGYPPLKSSQYQSVLPDRWVIDRIHAQPEQDPHPRLIACFSTRAYRGPFRFRLASRFSGPILAPMPMLPTRSIAFSRTSIIFSPQFRQSRTSNWSSTYIASLLALLRSCTCSGHFPAPNLWQLPFASIRTRGKHSSSCKASAPTVRESRSLLHFPRMSLGYSKTLL